MKGLMLIVALLVCIVGVSAIDAGNTLYQNPTGAGQAGAVTADMCKEASGVWTGTGCRIMPSYEDQKMNCVKSGGQWYVNGNVADGNWGCKDGNKTRFDQEQVRSTVEIDRSSVRGLENALIKVKYNQSRAVIEANIARIQLQRADIVAKLTNITAEHDQKTNTTKLVGFQKAKFLGIFPFQKQVEFDASGTAVTQKKNLLDILTTEG